MAKTDVHLYKMENIEYYANDWNPNTNIGMMLSELGRKFDCGNLILCAESHSPIILKQESKIHNFVGEHANDILKIVPFDSYWSQLQEKEVIGITAEEIADRAKKLETVETRLSKNYYFGKAAEKLLEEKLKEHNKDIGIFSNDKNKTAVFILNSFHPEVFVEKSSFDYKL